MSELTYLGGQYGEETFQDYDASLDALDEDINSEYDHGSMCWR